MLFFMYITLVFYKAYNVMVLNYDVRLEMMNLEQHVFEVKRKLVSDFFNACNLILFSFLLPPNFTSIVEK